MLYVERTIVGNDEYGVTHELTTRVGVEKALQPKPPGGQGWRLVTVVVEGASVFQYWRRRAPKLDGARVHYRFNGSTEQPSCKVMRGDQLQRIKTTRRKRDVTCKACRKSRLFASERGVR